MKHRKPPQPSKPGRLPEKLKYDRQVIKWTKRLKGHRTARPADLNEQQLTYVMREVHRRRHGEFNETLYEQAMAALTPVLAAPEMNDPIGDLEHVFAQPRSRLSGAGQSRPGASEVQRPTTAAPRR